MSGSKLFGMSFTDIWGGPKISKLEKRVKEAQKDVARVQALIDSKPSAKETKALVETATKHLKLFNIALNPFS